MSALGQKRTCAAQNVMSALPSKADMCSATRDVRFVPIADIRLCVWAPTGAISYRRSHRRWLDFASPCTPIEPLPILYASAIKQFRLSRRLAVVPSKSIRRNRSRCCLRLPLPAPAEQTQRAEAGGEERKCGWKWRCRQWGIANTCAQFERNTGVSG